MTKPNSNDRPALQGAKAANPESAPADNPELLAALAQFAGILEKAELPPVNDADRAPDKPVQ